MRQRARLSHKTIVELVGDRVEIARALGLAENTPAHWKTRGIPPVYWPAIARLAQKRGFDVTVDDMARTSPLPSARLTRGAA